jgi:rhodanese-related sulfurtransferase
MSEIQRIPPKEVHDKVTAGKALLVCAYEEPVKFAQMHLEGAISIQEFRARRSSLPKDQEIIFYCA